MFTYASEHARRRKCGNFFHHELKECFFPMVDWHHPICTKHAQTVKASWIGINCVIHFHMALVSPVKELLGSRQQPFAFTLQSKCIPLPLEFDGTKSEYRTSLVEPPMVILVQCTLHYLPIPYVRTTRLIS